MHLNDYNNEVAIIVIIIIYILQNEWGDTALIEDVEKDL